MTMQTQNPGKDRVFIFDTTLRDGEQCPGATMTLEEKLQVADLLDEKIVVFFFILESRMRAVRR